MRYVNKGWGGRDGVKHGRECEQEGERREEKHEWCISHQGQLVFFF